MYYFLFRGATWSIVELPIGHGLGMAEEHGSVTCSSIEPTIRIDEKDIHEKNAFVPETQADAVDYIDISSDVDTVPETQMDLDSDSVTKPLDRY